MKKYLIKLDEYLGLMDARVMQFDQLNSGTCKLEFELTTNRAILDLTGKRATLTVKTPRGAVIEDAILVTDAAHGKAECTLANDMVAEVGMHYGELNIYSNANTELFTTANFRYSISQQLGEGNIKVDTRYSTLQNLIFDVTELKDKSVIDIARVGELLKEANTVNTESKAINVETDKVNIKANTIKDQANNIKTLAEEIQADVTAKSAQVNSDAVRTANNARQVSTDKGVVTKFKNEVATNAEQVTIDKTIVASDKADTLSYKDAAEVAKNQAQQIKTDVQDLSTSTIANINQTGTIQTNRVTTEGTKQVNLAKVQADIATQKAQEISASANQINKNKREIVDTLPPVRVSGQLFFIRKG